MPKIDGLSGEKTIYQINDKDFANISNFIPGSMLAERYEILKLLGAGGMGVVYLVKDHKLDGHRRALKLMLEKLVLDEKSRKRFRNEILISQELTHSNILRVYDYGEDGNLLFFTMEYVAGPNMQDWLEEKRAKREISLPEIGELLLEVLEGLIIAHKTTVHRDIKPANILLPSDGRSKVKICDFGLARLQNAETLLTTGHALGTFNYMAPEQQFNTKDVDGRADLYSLGVMLYEALTREFPVGRFDLPSKLRPDLPEAIDDFIDKALKTKPERRYQSAEEMKKELRGILQEDTTSEKFAEAKESKATIPGYMVDEFVASHKGQWSYGEYQEFVERVRGEIGAITENEVRLRLERAKEHYQRKMKSSSSRGKSRIQERFEANLRRVEDSQLIEEFLQKTEGKWSERDWEDFLVKLQEEEYYPLNENALRSVLDQSTKTYQAAKADAEGLRQMLKPLEKGYDFAGVLEVLEEIQLMGYWDKSLEEKRQQYTRKFEEYKKQKTVGEKYLAEKKGLAAKEAWEKVLQIKPIDGLAKKKLEEARKIAGELEKRSGKKGFVYLREQRYSCGGQTNTVKEYMHEQTGLEFVLIPGKNYLMAKTVVTQVSWYKIMKTKPWQGKNYVRDGDEYPAVYVSWHDAQKFCEKTGLELPHEKEWKYACRAGTKTAYYWGDDMDGKYCWYDKNAWHVGEKYAHQVKQKLPNAFGLYDMSGNLWEWCQNAPEGNSSDRVFRGGSFRDSARYCESSYSGSSSPGYCHGSLGFRPRSSSNP